MSASTFDPTRPSTCTPSRAARELGLKRVEFDLAVQLGRIRTVPDEGGGGGRRVERAEIERLRAQDGFPESLRERVRVVGTAEGAALMEIPAGRFTRLARLGLLVPVKFYLNRYRAVVWLYLAEELRRFTASPEHAHLLKGRTPETLRGQLAAGVDLRARNWRARRVGFLLRQAEDPWARAGAVAAYLAPIEIADVVKDPYERAHLTRFRPVSPGQGASGSPSAQLAERITTAQDADEVGWLRSELARSVEEARDSSPAPRPAAHRVPPAMRAVARPIPPMARTVTRPTEETTRPCEPATRSLESAAPPPKPAAQFPQSAHGTAPSRKPAAPLPEPVTRRPEPVGRPAELGPRVLHMRTRLPESAAAQLIKAATAPTDSAVRHPESRVRSRELYVVPRESAVRPTVPPVPRDHEPAQPAPPPSSRGLRTWLRRRSARPARPARV
ncbi:hypothetical protein GCM10010300_65160 [Streptomyces olivaceoviridis]|uniref:DUF6397 family protein n=1 Tax=Streptomyces olivaceoviridis TaxID=1921 RepID=UPI0019C61D45|nr:hypothetical protein GCM10010300_65160 [Streptomyces olivaceoviridis]